MMKKAILGISVIGLLIVASCSDTSSTTQASIVGTWTFVNEEDLYTHNGHTSDTTLTSHPTLGVLSWTFLPNGTWTDVTISGGGPGIYQILNNGTILSIDPNGSAAGGFQILTLSDHSLVLYQLLTSGSGTDTIRSTDRFAR